MDYNFHTHTKRCGHASGEPEEYVRAAIAGGLRYYGFSDHMPHRFSDGVESGYRVPMAQGRAYCEEIRALAEKYKADIAIKVGFEMEFYYGDFETMLENAIAFGAEYLILGQHFIYDEHPNGRYVLWEGHTEADLCAYVKTVVDAIKTGVFTYVAHPDVFRFDGDVDFYREQMRKICVAARQGNVPLEINFLGIRENRIYPRALFWEIAGEEKAPVTFGLDAHRTEDACNKSSLVQAEKLVETYGLAYIGMPKIIDIRSLS